MIIVFRAPSGAGKSTLADLLRSTRSPSEGNPSTSEPVYSTKARSFVKTLWDSFIDREHRLGYFSADNYFLVNGVYQFDAKHLGTAHNNCLLQYTNAVIDPGMVAIVDNTNCSLVEVVPYLALASAYGHEIHVITLVGDPQKAWERNKHEVPYERVLDQDARLRDSLKDWPRWFPQHIFPF